MGDRAMADLAIGRVLAMQERIDHRILEMGAPPPGHEGIGIAAPALRLQERRCDRDQPALHVDDRAVLVEHAGFDVILDGVDVHGAAPFVARLVHAGELDQRRSPRRERIEDVRHHLAVAAARALRHMEGMIGAIDQMQSGAGAELLHERLEQVDLRELVGACPAGTAWHADIGEMIGAFAGRFSRRVQRKAEEGEADNAG